MNVERPSANRTSMNPPPPRFPAEGWVTANAKPTAIAASTALPPACSTATPASVACVSRVTTIAWRACTGCAAQPQPWRDWPQKQNFLLAVRGALHLDDKDKVARRHEPFNRGYGPTKRKP